MADLIAKKLTYFDRSRLELQWRKCLGRDDVADVCEYRAIPRHVEVVAHQHPEVYWT